MLTKQQVSASDLNKPVSRPWCRYEHDMMRCFDLAIRAPTKPGVRVLNAVAQHATISDGSSVAEILRGWWGADSADTIPGLRSYDRPGHGDGSVFDVQKCYDEIGFRSERRVLVHTTGRARL
jgi:hypothetical protein